MLKVCQRPELIQQLNHGLTFADDATVNEQLLIKYSLWQYLTPCDADNINILNSCINRWRDEANKLYETTRFSYDPLSNFQYNETGKDVRTPDLTDERTPDLTDETTLGTDTTRAEAGYDVPRTLFDAEKTTNSGTDTVTHTGTDTITHTGTDTTDHTLDRTGRSNVASQDLIAKERAIILDCISWYVEKFRNCFTVSLDIDDYCCGECLPFEPCKKDDAAEDIADLKNDIRDLQGDVAGLRAADAAMAGDISDLQGDVTDISGRVETLEGCCETVQGDITAINTELAKKAPIVFASLHGNNLHITDCAGAPIINCIVTVNAYQSGSGDPSPANPRSIYGYGRVDIWVTPDDGGPYTNYGSDWSGAAGTIYGGMLNIDTGELTVTWGMVDMGSLTWALASMSHDDVYVYGCTDNIGRYIGNDAQTMCEIYKFNGNGISTWIPDHIDDLTYCFRSNARYMYFRNDNIINDAAAFTASVTGYKLIFELETPLTYTITTARPVLVNGGCTVEEISASTNIIDGTYLKEEYEPLITLLSY